MPSSLAPEAAGLAVRFHDATHDPAAQDNETRDAALLLAGLTGRADAALLGRAAGMIRATATQAVPPGPSPDPARDTALFLDLSVLGADPDTRDACERGVAAEHGPGHGRARFLAGRRACLGALLDRPRLFLADGSHGRPDAPARTSINRAVEGLSGH